MPRLTYEDLLKRLEELMPRVTEVFPLPTNRERCQELFNAIGAGIQESRIRITEKKWIDAGEEVPQNALTPTELPKTPYLLKHWVEDQLEEINSRYGQPIDFEEGAEEEGVEDDTPAAEDVAAEDSDDEASVQEITPMNGPGKKPFVFSHSTTVEPVSYFSSDSSSVADTPSEHSDDELYTDMQMEDVDNLAGTDNEYRPTPDLSHAELAKMAEEALGHMAIESGPPSSASPTPVISTTWHLQHPGALETPVATRKTAPLPAYNVSMTDFPAASTTSTTGVASSSDGSAEVKHKEAATKSPPLHVLDTDTPKSSDDDEPMPDNSPVDGSSARNGPKRPRSPSPDEAETDKTKRARTDSVDPSDAVAPMQGPIQEPMEKLIEEPMQEPMEEAMEEPMEEPMEELMHHPMHALMHQPTQQPSSLPAAIPSAPLSLTHLMQAIASMYFHGFRDAVHDGHAAGVMSAEMVQTVSQIHTLVHVDGGEDQASQVGEVGIGGEDEDGDDAMEEDVVTEDKEGEGESMEMD
jgi:hypothetical protein